MKDLENVWSKIIRVFDNKTVQLATTVILFLLLTTLFSNINRSIVDIMDNKFIRIIVLIFIVALIPRHPTIAILLAMVYIISMRGAVEFFENMGTTTEETIAATVPQNDETKEEKKEEVKEKVEEKKEEKTSEGFKKSKNSIPNSLDVDAFVNQATDLLDGMLGVEKPEQAEHFIPFFMSNSDFETSFDSPLKTARHNKGCLNTDPNHFELVGDACKPVATFRDSLNAQGMNEIAGFNIDNNMTAQPI